ncbi:PLDc N-terminal domain-containing protein [Granulosicoccus sp.]|nr:PLDc N-terminal domain-containing protein [Granulosicoccus sp.]
MDFIGGLFGGLFSLVIFVLDVYAIIRIVNSSATTGMKVVWVLIVAVVPVVGFIAWYLAGPKS